MIHIGVFSTYMHHFILKIIMKNLCIFLSLFIHFSCSQIKEKIYSNYLALPENDNNFKTELSYDIIENNIILFPIINGRKCRMLFDTGARSFLSSNLIDSLKLDIHSTITTKDIFQNKITTTKHVCDLSLNSLKIYDFKITKNHNINNECFDLDGIIGKEMLNQGVFYFNSSTKKLLISNTISNFDLKGFQKIKIEYYLGDIFITYRRKKYVLDSGFNNGFILTKDNKLFNDIDSIKVQKRIVGGLHSKKTINIKYQKHSMQIDSVKYLGTICSSNEINYNLFGSKWFIDNEIILDVNNKYIYIKKNNKLNTKLDSLKNINFQFSKNNVIISSLSTKINNVNIGDTIIQINDINLINIKSSCEFDQLLSKINYNNGINIVTNNKKNIFFSKNQLFNY